MIPPRSRSSLKIYLGRDIDSSQNSTSRPLAKFTLRSLSYFKPLSLKPREPIGLRSASHLLFGIYSLYSSQLPSVSAALYFGVAVNRDASYRLSNASSHS